MQPFPPDFAAAEVAPSPNFGERRGVAAPDLLVLHYTGTETAEEALARLRDPAIVREDDMVLRGAIQRIQFYAHGPHRIWGATARVIAEFLDSAYPEILAAQVSHSGAVEGAR